MHLHSRLLINVVSNWGASVVRAVIGLVLVPFLINDLGRAGYGLISLLAIVISSAAISDFGLRKALGRHLAEQIAREDVERFNKLASTGFCIYAVIGVLCAGLCGFLAPWIGSLFNVSPAMADEAIGLIRWYAPVMILINFISPVFGAVITSSNRFDLWHGVTAGIAIINGCALLLILSMTDLGLSGWAGVTAFTTFLRLGLYVVMSRYIRPGLCLRLKYFDGEALRSLFSLGGYMYVIQLKTTLNSKVNPLVITQFFGPAGVALYTPGGSLPNIIRPLVRALSAQLYPVTTGYHVTQNYDKLQSILIKVTKYTFLMGIPVCVVLGGFAIPLMHHWLGTSLGPDYLTPAYIMMGWSVVDLFGFAGGGQWAVLLGMNRVKFPAFFTFAMSVVSILISIYLVGWTDLGILGIIVAGMISAIIKRPVIAVYTARMCGMSPKRYFEETYPRPLIVLLLLGLLAWWVQTMFDPFLLSGLFTCLIVVFFAWAILCWFVGFRNDDRVQLSKTLLSSVSRIRAKITGASTS